MDNKINLKLVLFWTVIVLIIINLIIICNKFSGNGGFISERRIPVEVHIEPNFAVGFNIDTDMLRFGHLGAGGREGRYINISNNNNFTVRAEIYHLNNSMGSWIYYDKSEYIIPPMKNQNVLIYLKVPGDAVPGYYQNEILVRFYKY